MWWADPGAGGPDPERTEAGSPEPFRPVSLQLSVQQTPGQLRSSFHPDISEHFDLPVTVNQLAEIENYNVTYYNDWFKQQTGCSPSLYLRKIRIDRAKELLLESRYTMMEIALMVGYSSNSTFTRAFHSITGKTPKAFREEHGIVSAV